MIDDLEPNKAPIEQRLASDHMGACGKHLRLQLQTRYRGEKLDQLALWIFDIARSWIGRRLSVMLVSFCISYQCALLRAGAGQSKAQQSKIDELIQTFQDEVLLYIMLEFEGFGDPEGFEDLLDLEGSEEW